MRGWTATWFAWVCTLASCGGDAHEPQDSGTTTDAGAPAPLSWSAPERIGGSTTYADQRTNWGNSIAVSEAGTVHATWRVVDDPNVSPVVARAVWRRRDVQYGWQGQVDLSPSVAGIGHPKIAVSGNDVFVAWHRYHPDPASFDQIFVAVSTGDGYQWTWQQPTVAVSDAPVVVSPAGELSTTPSIAAYGHEVYVVWSDDRVVASCGTNVPEVYLTTSSDYGETWSAPLMVSEPDCRSSWTPSVAATYSDVHIAWTDDRHNTDDCALGAASCHEEEYYRRLSDFGTTLSGTEIRLTTDPGSPVESWAGNIAVNDDAVHYTWMDMSGGDGFEIFYSHSTDGGDDWALPGTQLTVASGGCLSARPTVAVEGTHVHLVYFELCGDTDATVWHRWSADGGVTWSAPSDVTSGSAVFAIQPSVAVHAGRVHVLWTDQGEMFYATASTP